jgi:hypothetical protein
MVFMLPNPFFFFFFFFLQLCSFLVIRCGVAIRNGLKRSLEGTSLHGHEKRSFCQMEIFV